MAECTAGVLFLCVSRSPISSLPNTHTHHTQTRTHISQLAPLFPSPPCTRPPTRHPHPFSENGHLTSASPFLPFLFFSPCTYFCPLLLYTSLYSLCTYSFSSLPHVYPPLFFSPPLLSPSLPFSRLLSVYLLIFILSCYPLSFPPLLSLLSSNILFFPPLSPFLSHTQRKALSMAEWFRLFFLSGSPLKGASWKSRCEERKKSSL